MATPDAKPLILGHCQRRKGLFKCDCRTDSFQGDLEPLCHEYRIVSSLNRAIESGCRHAGLVVNRLAELPLRIEDNSAAGAQNLSRQSNRAQVRVVAPAEHEKLILSRVVEKPDRMPDRSDLL